MSVKRRITQGRSEAMASGKVGTPNLFRLPKRFGMSPSFAIIKSNPSRVAMAVFTTLRRRSAKMIPVAMPKK